MKYTLQPTLEKLRILNVVLLLERFHVEGFHLKIAFFFFLKKFLKYFHKHHNYNKNPKGKQKVYYHLIRKQEQESNKRAYDKEKSPATQTRECH